MRNENKGFGKSYRSPKEVKLTVSIAIDYTNCAYLTYLSGNGLYVMFVNLLCGSALY